MTSHEYANKLKALAEWLLSKPEVDAHTDHVRESFWYWSAKEPFLAAVRALKPGRKEYGEGTNADALALKFYPAGVPEGVDFYLRINRSAMCRLIQEAKYECEPLLSPEEEAQIE
jgi:hypothetical protein